MRLFDSLFSRRDKSFHAARGSGLGPPAASPYASVDPGIGLVPVPEVIAQHDDLLQRIRLTYGTDRPTFERNILRVVEKYAAYCHLLPATADNYFNDPGGLFRMGLEIGFFALQGTDGYIFAEARTISERAQMEPRWRYATFIAGLLSEVHRAMSHLIVTGEDGQDWPPYMLPLAEWAGSRRFARYFLRWRPTPVETRSLGLFAARHVVDSDVLEYLSSGNNTIVPQMLGTIGGLPSHREPNMIERLVRTCTAVVIQNNLTATASRYGRPIIGAHLERYLVDAMQRLVATGTWAVNEPRSRLWYGADGLFLIWPNSVGDILRLLEKDRVPGIPKSPETIAEILVSAHVLRCHVDGGTVHQIAPPGASQRLGAVLLSSPMILLSALAQAPRPLDVALAVAGAPSLSGPQPVGAVEVDAGRVKIAEVASHDEEDNDDEGNDDEDSGASHGDAGSIASEAAASGRVTGREANAGSAGKQQVSLAAGSVIGETGSASGTVAKRGERTEVGACIRQERAVGGVKDVTARFALRAPVHLNPAVRAALAEIVETLNEQAGSACCTMPRGVFVPLAQFKGHSVDTGIAVASLFESGMLATTKGAKTIQHEFDGQRTLGVCILPEFVAGLDPSAFSEVRE